MAPPTRLLGDFVLIEIYSKKTFGKITPSRIIIFQPHRPRSLHELNWDQLCLAIIMPATVEPMEQPWGILMDPFRIITKPKPSEKKQNGLIRI